MVKKIREFGKDMIDMITEAKEKRPYRTKLETYMTRAAFIIVMGGLLGFAVRSCYGDVEINKDKPKTEYFQLRTTNLRLENIVSDNNYRGHS